MCALPSGALRTGCKSENSQFSSITDKMGTCQLFFKKNSAFSRFLKKAWQKLSCSPRPVYHAGELGETVRQAHSLRNLYYARFGQVLPFIFRRKTIASRMQSRQNYAVLFSAGKCRNSFKQMNSQYHNRMLLTQYQVC